MPLPRLAYCDKAGGILAHFLPATALAMDIAVVDDHIARFLKGTSQVFDECDGAMLSPRASKGNREVGFPFSLVLRDELAQQGDNMMEKGLCLAWSNT